MNAHLEVHSLRLEMKTESYILVFLALETVALVSSISIILAPEKWRSNLSTFLMLATMDEISASRHFSRVRRTIRSDTISNKTLQGLIYCFL